MNVHGVPYRTIRLAPDGAAVEVIDQRRLPRELVLVRLATLEEAARAIKEMWIRGAPLIGVTAAYGVALALRADASDASLARACELLVATRPTAINLRWAVERMRAVVAPATDRAAAAYREAAAIAEEDVATCRAIGEHGATLLAAIHARTRRPVQVLTHCNAGWLATVDWGTALAPVYRAHDDGLPLHVWVDETRPRNQGLLTAWELAAHGVPHTLIVDNAGGHLMQRGAVDVCLVGTDRTTASGDVCNKIGTYLKALAAKAHDVPFYAAVPSSSIDWSLEDGVAIPIEEREPDEVLAVPLPGTRVANPAFDVTPRALVTGLITERGVATPAGLRALFAGVAR